MYQRRGILQRMVLGHLLDMVARGMGAQGHTVRTVEDFKALDFKKMSFADGPTLLDIYIDPEAVPPMGMRVDTLKRQQKNTNESD